MVIAPEHPLIEKYASSITADGLIYRGYMVSNLNPNIDKPFIGKNAAARSQQDLIRRAEEAKERALEQLRQKQSVGEFKRSQMSLARALTRLEFSSQKKHYI
jgi:hypothetical protein